MPWILGIGVAIIMILMILFGFRRDKRTEEVLRIVKTCGECDAYQIQKMVKQHGIDVSDIDLKCILDDLVHRGQIGGHKFGDNEKIEHGRQRYYAMKA